MKTYILSILCTLFLSITIHSQTEVVLSSFNAINVSGNINVNLKQGTPKALVSITRGNESDLILKVEDKTLNIRFENQKWGWGNNMSATIDLYFVELDEIDLSAGASLSSSETLSFSEIDISGSSGASLDMEFTAENLDASVSSGASLSISGHSTNAEYDCSSGGSINAHKLIAETVDASCSSGGSISAYASKDIDASASSGGSIRYDGNPSEKDISEGKLSGGSISQM